MQEIHEGILLERNDMKTNVEHRVERILRRQDIGKIEMLFKSLPAVRVERRVMPPEPTFTGERNANV